MALTQKTSPVGIDKSIDNLQVQLFNKLTSWTGAIKSYQSYPKAYKNKTNNGDVPELFTGENDYKELFNDDNFSATSFFLVSDNRPVDKLISTDVDIIFQVNLDDVYGSREDEKAHQEVYNILYDNPWGYSVTGIITGINNVYSDLGISQVSFDDMQPFHVFKISMNIIHNMRDC